VIIEVAVGLPLLCVSLLAQELRGKV